MNEQQAIETFLSTFARIADAMEAIADELREINAALVAVEEVQS